MPRGTSDWLASTSHPALKRTTIFVKQYRRGQIKIHHPPEREIPKGKPRWQSVFLLEGGPFADSLAPYLSTHDLMSVALSCKKLLPLARSMITTVIAGQDFRRCHVTSLTSQLAFFPKLQVLDLSCTPMTRTDYESLCDLLTSRSHGGNALKTLRLSHRDHPSQVLGLSTNLRQPWSAELLQQIVICKGWPGKVVVAVIVGAIIVIGVVIRTVLLMVLDVVTVTIVVLVSIGNHVN